MNGRMVSPQEQRRFALEVVGRLRQAGFEAYWAGGCVRDELLGRVPKDYDVATSATPPEIRDLFGHRRTLALGAAFGVITVKGPRKAGMVEVATFRRDAAYSDGRHPDHVTFSSAREDAARRDFTINGLFFDPLRQQVIDFVGGREDLARRVIRAIGQPARRMAEDKLRLLRAVRFAAAFDFALDEDTAATIRAMAAQIAVVSPERIAMEMRRMLMERGRARAVGLLLETGLAAALLPEIVHTDPNAQQRLDRALAVLDRLDEPGFPLALAALLDSMVESSAARAICLRWRLSNKETDRVAWLIAHRSALAGAPAMRHSQLQPLLLAEGIEDLLVLHELSGPPGPEDAAFCRALLAGPRDRLDPPPLLSGDDLLAAGLPSGPRYKTALRRIRAAQLDGEIHTRDEALVLAQELLNQ